MGVKRKNPADDASDSSAPDSKKSKSDSYKKLPKKTDDDGNTYWELSSKRRVTITEFKGQTFLGIREFYEKDGKMLPGKAGINLKVEQVAGFVLALPEILDALKEAADGVNLPSVTVASGESDGGGDNGEEDGGTAEKE